MLTFQIAFNEGLVSPTLKRLWWDDDPANWSRESTSFHGSFRYWLFLLGSVALVSLIFLNWPIRAMWWFPLGSIVVGLAAIGIIGLIKNPMKKFLHDCTRLGELVNEAGFKSESELRKMAEEKLIVLAQEVLINRLVGNNRESRSRFGDAFLLFQCFRLTEKNWDPYFKAAEKRNRVLMTEEV